ncbi:tripeptidyl-peptidase 1-like [Planoprotostelium fungivorum]|uniref:Tripeptidyl-peptidase 1-like n=1 Tax=Planoprotostelium fungivorum TaxID=1890364 RepID=A0A2P6NVF7_9EUKA|nr:tripeptidyl-peptidase 1-like [Planoprotostelium fungivorum]
MPSRSLILTQARTHARHARTHARTHVFLPLYHISISQDANTFSIGQPLEDLFGGGSLPGTDWLLKGPADPQAFHTVTFAAKPKARALDLCTSEVEMNTSPTSPSFGTVYDATRVHNMFSQPEATQQIQKFLKTNNMKSSTRGEFTTVTAPVHVLEKVLGAKFLRFTSITSRLSVLRTSSYTVPSQLTEYVSFITNTVSFPLARRHIRAHDAYSDKSITPRILFRSYSMSDPIVKNADATQSVFGALSQSYDPADLLQFQKINNLHPTPVANVIGPNFPKKCSESMDHCSEASLDMQYIMGVAQNASTVYWAIPDGSQDPFLEWIMSVSAMARPPLVHSISYGAVEALVPAEHMDRFTLEACKLGLRGVTIVVSSGDDGVANYIAQDDLKQCGFSPSFPASCPFVLSVGATQGLESGKPETACSSDKGGQITTGGGFSRLFGLPSWQRDFVHRYLYSGNTTKLPSFSSFSYNGRGYPDISAAGHSYSIVIGGQSVGLSGTSAATPVIAAMLTHINSERLSLGKSPLGFVNPAIYHAARAVKGAFNDITTGDNRCLTSPPEKPVCCPSGFQASAGWDPVTGVGTPNFDKLKEALVSMR